MTKFLEKHDENKLNVRFKREEHFRRAGAKTVAQMVLYGEGQLEADQNDEDEGPLSVGDRDYLLLDVRDIDEYEKGRIVSSVSYPAAMLSRSQNQYIPEIYQFKNKEGKVIVIYDDNELITVNMGNLLFEKGFDNIFVLTGGLSKFAAEYPELVQGEAPPPPKPSKTARGSGGSTARSNAGSVRAPGAVAGPGDSLLRNNSDARSVAASTTTARSVRTRVSLGGASQSSVGHPSAWH